MSSHTFKCSKVSDTHHGDLTRKSVAELPQFIAATCLFNKYRTLFAPVCESAACLPPLTPGSGDAEAGLSLVFKIRFLITTDVNNDCTAL